MKYINIPWATVAIAVGTTIYLAYGNASMRDVIEQSYTDRGLTPYRWFTMK